MRRVARDRPFAIASATRSLISPSSTTCLHPLRRSASAQSCHRQVLVAAAGDQHQRLVDTPAAPRSSARAPSRSSRRRRSRPSSLGHGLQPVRHAVERCESPRASPRARCPPRAPRRIAASTLARLCRPRSGTSAGGRAAARRGASAASPARYAPSTAPSRLNCSDATARRDSAASRRRRRSGPPSRSRDWCARIWPLAAQYASMVGCRSRWFGVTLVTSGDVRADLQRLELKAGQLHARPSSRSDISSSLPSSGRPMLPPTKTSRPAAAKISPMRLVVVLLPALPVMPRIGAGQSAKNSSTRLLSLNPALSRPPAAARARAARPARHTPRRSPSRSRNAWPPSR